MEKDQGGTFTDQNDGASADERHHASRGTFVVEREDGEHGEGVPHHRFTRNL